MLDSQALDAIKAQRLAGQDWHTLSDEDTRTAIVLQHVSGLLGPHIRQAGEVGGSLTCKVGNYTGPTHH